MKLETILGKYYADGIEITPEQYKNYSNSLAGKNFQIHVIQENKDNSEIDQLKSQIEKLNSQVEELSLKISMILGDENNA